MKLMWLKNWRKIKQLKETKSCKIYAFLRSLKSTCPREVTSSRMMSITCLLPILLAAFCSFVGSALVRSRAQLHRLVMYKTGPRLGINFRSTLYVLQTVAKGEFTTGGVLRCWEKHDWRKSYFDRFDHEYEYELQNSPSVNFRLIHDQVEIIFQ